MFRNFRVDLVSFVIGFLAASLFWWLLSRLRPLIPGLLQSIKKFVQTMRQRNLEGADEYLRKDTLRRAEKMHLTAAMFPLDEILVPPLLLAPPVPVEPDQPPAHETIAGEIIPYMPDWPELAAGHGAASFTLAEALQNGANIAVIGRPGCGKTVVLADLAIRLARNDPSLGKIANFLPIYLHILDIQSNQNPGEDPLPAFFQAVSPHVAVIYQAQLRRLILDRAAEGEVILLLDGLDELHPSALLNAVKYLQALREKLPHLRIVAAASTQFQDGLVHLKLVPLGVAAWGPAERETFLRKWSQAWAAHIAPEIAKHEELFPVSPLLLDNWLRGERGFPTPLEWTLRIWGAYSGDLQPAPLASLATLFSRFATGITSASALETLAREFVLREQAALPYETLDNLLTSLSPANPVFVEAPVEPVEAPLPEPAPGRKNGKSEKRDMILSVGEQILENLVKGGILIEHPRSQIRFASPVFAGYLAGRSLSVDTIAAALRSPFWSLSDQTLRFASAASDDAGWVETFLRSEDTPLYRPLLAASRWLADGKPGPAWRGSIFRQLLNGLQNDLLPFSLRSRMLAAFVVSNDPSAPKLFKQLVTARTPSVRLLAALGLGAWGESSFAGELIAMLGDYEESVRNAACLGLVSLHSDTALSAVADILLNGDERLRQAAAESLVHLPEQGAEIIREAAKVNDILTRRAAVFGLLQIREPWSRQMLEKMAVEDGQWVVRNAAAQALEVIQKSDPRVPTPLPAPHESPWLTAFAGKRNLGLSPNLPATDVLLLALKAGTLEDQLAALRYLKDMPEDPVINAVYNVYYGDQDELKNAAYLAIWQWALAGVELPSPTSFGIAVG